MAIPTFTNIVQQIRRISDIEDDGNHITDEEIKEDFNNSLNSLWSIIVNLSNGSLVSKVAPELPQLGNNSYQLPEDFLRLVSVDIKRSSNIWVHSTEADPQRYAQLLELSGRVNSFSQHYLQFNTKQGWYELFIFPSAEPTYLFVRYVPYAPQLELDTDVLMLPGDWKRWAVYDTAIKCYIKNEQDPSVLVMEREKVEQRVIEDVRASSPAQVETIRDVSDWEQAGRFVLPDINYG
jgi:hypothetical protein